MAEVIVLMGVSGSGKTTVGRLLAHALSASFYDADDYHLPENKHKMQSGIALNDSERLPLASLKFGQWLKV
jgi:gluconokinase